MTNEQAQSYMIIAMHNLGFSEEDIKKVYYAMKSEFDYLTEEEAEEKANRIWANFK